MNPLMKRSWKEQGKRLCGWQQGSKKRLRGIDGRGVREEVAGRYYPFFCQQAICWIDFFWNFRLSVFPPVVASSHPALLEFTLLLSFVSMPSLWEIKWDQGADSYLEAGTLNLTACFTWLCTVLILSALVLVEYRSRS